jgi:acetyl esterase/lipase
MAAQGWLCVSINYRLSPRARWPDHLVDVKRALAWVKEHISDYGGNPDFIIVTGGSAGGPLAAMAALTPGEAQWQPGFTDADTSVQGAVICYGVYDLVERHRLWCYRGWRWFMRRLVLPRQLGDPEAMLAEASPLSWIGPQAPPFMVLHGRHDSLICCRQARAFIKALRAQSEQAVVYAELPYAQHAFDLFWSPRALAVVRGIHRFGETLRPPINQGFL